jgi:SAM-dependent methyltransferase
MTIQDYGAHARRIVTGRATTGTVETLSPYVKRHRRNLATRQTRIETALARIRAVAHDRGLLRALLLAVKWVVWDGNALLAFIGYLYHRERDALRTFTFAGRTYSYFCHRYNNTWRNERAVEVPIIRALLEENRGKRVLEVGDVLSHYIPVGHDVLDKYDGNDRVIRQDVAEYRTPKKYDLIVSISTLEHVGWDESPRDPQKVQRAIANLKSMLAPGGQIVATVPLGYNPALDSIIRDGELPFTRCSYMKRMPGDNRWLEMDWPGVAGSEYNFHVSANALLIGTIENGGAPAATTAPPERPIRLP